MFTDITRTVWLSKFETMTSGIRLLKLLGKLISIIPITRINWADYTCPNDAIHRPLLTSGSAIAEGPREALVNRNPATTK